MNFEFLVFRFCRCWICMEVEGVGHAVCHPNAFARNHGYSLHHMGQDQEGSR